MTTMISSVCGYKEIMLVYSNSDDSPAYIIKHL